MTLFDSVRDELSDLISTARTKVETQALGAAAAVQKALLPAIPGAMKILQDTAASGAAKKAAVLQFLGELYDQVIEPIDLPGPDTILDPLLKKSMIIAADRLIDVFADFFKSPDAASVVAAFQPAA